ncbi:hypothetical protein ACR6C2_14780 [Streptomyces sp. INA 01156]
MPPRDRKRTTRGRGGESRRDRKAVAHRRRRRRTLLIAAGVILTAGALGLAGLGTDAPGSKPEPTATADETPNGGSVKVGSAPPPSGARARARP